MILDFNLDCDEFEQVDINSMGSVVTKRDDIALIDADTLVFAACLHSEQQVELLSREFYTDEEWEEIINNPSYDEEEQSICTIDMDYAMSYSKEKLQTILDNTGCSDYELHFTSGRHSFRYTLVDKQYKANRTEDKTKRAPLGLHEIKDMWVKEESNKCFIWEEWEADDIVVAKKSKWPDKYLLVALDKDVLYSLEGTHFNYYSSSLYNIDMKFFDVSKETAMKHHYRQTLTGDTSDGVYGLKGIGPKKADKLLMNCNNEQECWDAVVKAYEDIGILKNGVQANIIDAITNMRLVNMHQLVYMEDIKEWEVKLWKPEFM